MVKNLIVVASILLLACTLHAQTDPALLTVKGRPVPVSEFKYIYAKTNQDKADFSEKSLREYLELYTNFKLKVQKARDMRLDTIASLNSELEGYKKQLAKSYLEDKELTDKLIREAYDRMQLDVDVSHMVVNCDRNRPAADTLRAYNRASNWLKMIRKGADFNTIARDSSEDKFVKENGGNLGFITAMLPDGYYDIEKALYSAKVGDIIGPVRSNAGYHLLRLNGTRPARGEMEVNQILIRKGDTPEKHQQKKMRADSAYNALIAGEKWDAVCTKFSEDKTTSAKGGYLGFFGINRYQKAFEDAAFGLQNDGDYTKPVETTLGFHIIQRKSRRPIGSFDQLKRGLTERIKRDSRSETARQSMISQIKKEGQFMENSKVLAAWSAKQTDTVFHTFKWKPDPAKPQDVLFSYGADKKYTVADFEDFCQRSGRERMRGAGYPLQETINKLYKSWGDETALAFEESQLDKKYPEFKSLMREYEEGILLFEALKQNVWDRANSDSMGLQKYYDEELKMKYQWKERARVTFYTLKTDDIKVIAKVREMAAKKPAADVLKKFNKKGKPEVLTVMEKLYEKDKNKDLGALWKAGDMTETKTDAGTKTASFIKIEELVPPSPKQLSEARGYAVADYQDYLEKKWIQDLRKEYQVVIDEGVLKSLIKK
ncbi:MAG: peptidylprolyl isomerase [Saprospiraceae bacterium]|nr:peptidylprolyl isomerase [Saprospiraceae bacterium]